MGKDWKAKMTASEICAKKLASLRQLQSETHQELDALLPSVLDRAFKGES